MFSATNLSALLEAENVIDWHAMGPLTSVEDLRTAFKHEIAWLTDLTVPLKNLQ